MNGLAKRGHRIYALGLEPVKTEGDGVTEGQITSFVRKRDHFVLKGRSKLLLHHFPLAAGLRGSLRSVPTKRIVRSVGMVAYASVRDEPIHVRRLRRFLQEPDKYHGR